jgi:UDP-N-acetylmuramoyl-L-alanyl-D-glutamate--2,6-diaminopimelate ligase
VRGVPGRMERFALPAGPALVVDYAHTALALESALRALRPHTSGRLWVVFGCGGERDPGKRPEMGAIATRMADEVIVTDDNPRHENPAAIRREILDGCAGPAVPREIGDRAAGHPDRGIGGPSG